MKNAAEFQVNEDDVFGRIASRYDLLCDLFSFGIHRLWKRRVAQLISQEPWIRLLDVASGTGDIVLRILDGKRLAEGYEVIVSDISPKMLAIAKQRLSRYSKYTDFQTLDAHSISRIGTSSLTTPHSLCTLTPKILKPCATDQTVLKPKSPGQRTRS